MNDLLTPKRPADTFLEKNYEDDEDKAENQVKDEEADEPDVDSKLPIQTQRLMELIFNQNHFNAVLEQIGYNANKLPLGKLSKATLKQGFEHLREIASLIKHPSLAENKYSTSQKEVSNLLVPLRILHWQFCAAIPHWPIKTVYNLSLSMSIPGFIVTTHLIESACFNSTENVNLGFAGITSQHVGDYSVSLSRFHPPAW